jgi:hypothetical protein
LNHISNIFDCFFHGVFLDEGLILDGLFELAFELEDAGLVLGDFALLFVGFY